MQEGEREGGATESPVLSPQKDLEPLQTRGSTLSFPLVLACVLVVSVALVKSFMTRWTIFTTSGGSTSDPFLPAFDWNRHAALESEGGFMQSSEKLQPLNSQCEILSQEGNGSNGKGSYGIGSIAMGPYAIGSYGNGSDGNGSYGKGSHGKGSDGTEPPALLTHPTPPRCFPPHDGPLLTPHHPRR